MYFGEKKSKNSSLELSYLKTIRYWHRPFGGLAEVSKKAQEMGVYNPMLLDKDHVELYIGSLLAIGLEEYLDTNFWIAKPENDPPDMVFMEPRVDQYERIKFYVREVEIVRHIGDKESLVNTILSKDTKAYPPDYVLACFLENAGEIDLREVSGKLRGKINNIENIFIVFMGGPATDRPRDLYGKATVVQVSPVFNPKVVDIPQSLKKWESADQKLIYAQDAKVYFGLRKGENYPKIIN